MCRITQLTQLTLTSDFRSDVLFLVHVVCLRTLDLASVDVSQLEVRVLASALRHMPHLQAVSVGFDGVDFRNLVKPVVDALEAAGTAHSLKQLAFQTEEDAKVLIFK